jgi:L-seryl-tRNA(Ser) seleniumtransferase
MDVTDLPAVDSLARELAASYDIGHPIAVAIARDTLSDARAGRVDDPVADARRRVSRLAGSRLRTVVNATGVLLHTNLGRAPFPTAAVPAGYTTLEFDLADGTRGERGGYLHRLIAATVGAEAALAVNNNAGALLLALAALAGAGGEVAVSRGELIEIGGSFRLPDLMAASGATLVEVGTTNRTRRSDIANVAGRVDALLKVHPSNYRVEGFTESVGFAAMAEIARESVTPFIADLGSGLLDTRTPWLEGGPPAWLVGEPGARQTIADGADVVLFSGDKLLGGPQAGIAAGTAAAIRAMATHPLARALRIDHRRIASLTGLFELYAAGRGAEIPFWTMATAPSEEIEARARLVLKESGVAAEMVEGSALPGAGSVPGSAIPTPVIRLAGDADAAWHALADHDPPVVASRKDGATVVNLRSVLPEEDRVVAAALAGT